MGPLGLLFKIFLIISEYLEAVSSTSNISKSSKTLFSTLVAVTVELVGNSSKGFNSKLGFSTSLASTFKIVSSTFLIRI